MKIRCNETGRVTTVKPGEAGIGSDEIEAAMTRIIRREDEYKKHGHFAAQFRPGDLYEFRDRAACRKCEIVRGVGGLTEHTGDFYTFSEV
jgi:hypothetical protein